MTQSDWKKGDCYTMKAETHELLVEEMKKRLAKRYTAKNGHYRANKTGIALKLIAVNQDGTKATFEVE